MCSMRGISRILDDPGHGTAAGGLVLVKVRLVHLAALVSTPSFEVSKEGKVSSFKTSTVAKSMELKFKVGKEFEETTSDGRTVDTLVTMDGPTTFVPEQTAKNDGQKSTKTVRDIKDGKCTQVTEVVGWI
ncbi:unnamed protein product [Lepeophtheirus salmonis]|uniref:(salmon louse) hypothetical protein n=1 Tax=Lepeophtheirus salmonis TaxID=72036 RepID=A0A7R8D3B0_LEPSM|nr:unnamed protein product [Lepeophtheirus salmonis]CAF3015030.1 unnamed protein product [Lepeophtheirus salmonis]